MDTVYYATGILMILVLLSIPAATIIFLIKPKLLNKSKRIKKPISRKVILAVSILSLIVSFFGFGAILGATEPANVKQNRIAREQAEEKKIRDAEKKRLKAIEANKPKIKEEIKLEAIKFDTKEQPDGNIPAGERRVATAGANGERTITYKVTYIKGVEQSRSILKNEVTKQPISQLVLVGTYVKPAQPAPSTSGSGYVNSQGNYVQSPSSNPAGASAQCADGTYSYSQSRRGTCSHHGGVATWL